MVKPSIAKRTGKAVSGVCLIAEHETVIAEAIALLYILNVHHTPNISDEMDAFISGGLAALNTEVSDRLVASFKRVADHVEGEL